MSFFYQSSSARVMHKIPNKQINYQDNYQYDDDKILRILLVGTYGVGKTSIIQKLVFNKFESMYSSTIGVDFSIKRLTINNSYVKLHIWDTAGQERFKSITKSFYRNNSTYLLVFDLSDYSTFRELNNFITDINKSSINSKFFLIGNKSDLKKDDRINDFLIKEFIESNKILKYFKVSSKLTDFNTIFEEISKILIEQTDILNNNINNTIKLINENSEDERNITGCC